MDVRITVHGSSIARDGFLISSDGRAIDFHEKLISRDPKVIVSLEQSIARDGDLTSLDGNLFEREENLIEWDQEMRARECASARGASAPRAVNGPPTASGSR
jgi:hypothetical protein